MLTSLLCRSALLLLAVALSACAFRAAPRVQYRLPAVSVQAVGAPYVRDARADFAELFCGVLATYAEWPSCGDVIEGARPPAVSIGPIPTGTSVLVVPGILSQCFERSGIAALSDAATILEAKNVHVRGISVSGLGSSTTNASQIRDFLQKNPGRHILVGYSKGIADIMEAVAMFPEIRPSIRAVVSLAGAVYGSRLPDLLEGDFLSGLQETLRSSGMGDCEVRDAGGVQSLTRAARYSAALSYPAQALPSYSVAAVAPRNKTSKVLQPLWDRLEAYSLDHDSQVIAEESVVPGSTYLATLIADHWAVALPMGSLPEPRRSRVLKYVDQNRYPRPALLEAIVRFIIRDEARPKD